MASDAPQPPVPDLRRLFRPQPHRFEFGIRPGAEDWFRLPDPPPPELGHRRELLAAAPERHAPWLPEAEPVFDGLVGWFSDPDVRALTGGGAAAARTLGGLWPPDYVLLGRDPSGNHRMVGGCVCDPSWWDPQATLGRPVAAIHEVVPGLNAQLGDRIRTFLDRLPADTVVTRENWGLAAVPDRNLHPTLGRPRLGPDATPETTWLRVEHQAFRALPDLGGMVFLIWLTVHPLTDVLRDPVAAGGLALQLETLPDPVAAYKGVAAARSNLAHRLRHAAEG
ncbi:MAG: DUF3445 domain-containing protein [Verrucomicrobiae bacterium]|nr:DUF3445 domain-containing protein [Verrucomicrobiae bacterium]